MIDQQYDEWTVVCHLFQFLERLKTAGVKWDLWDLDDYIENIKK